MHRCIYLNIHSFNLESVHLAKTISTLVDGCTLPWTSQEAFGQSHVGVGVRRGPAGEGPLEAWLLGSLPHYH